MKTRTTTVVLASTLALFAFACGGGSGNGDGDGDCAEGETRCTGNTFESCQDGAFATEDLCTGLCDPGLGCVDCRPGVNFCDTANNVVGCSDSGSITGVVEACGEETCVNGNCVDLCGDAEEEQSYIGCEYFAVDLDNALQVNGEPFIGMCPGFPFGPDGVVITTDVCIDANDVHVWHCDGDGSCPDPATQTCTPDTSTCAFDASSSPFAVVVSNPQQVDIDVTVETSSMSMVVNVAAGEVKPIFPADLGMPDQSINHTATGLAFKLSSNAPFVAYQFNPLDNVDVFSNDGSLLLPRHSFDNEYFVLTMPSLDINGRRGYATIIAHEDATEVSITPTADIAAGPVIPAILAGTTQTFTLNAFDALNIEAAGTGDLTGTIITTTDPLKSVGVFTGHEATSLPAAGADCCADHLEEMLFPASTWGTEYLVAKSQQRLAGETDIVRIVAQTDATNISFNGGGAPSCAVLSRGEFCEVDIDSDVEISADQPIMVGHILRSTVQNGVGGIGDPSLALAVPTEQFRSSYSFLIPADYDMQYASIIAPAGETAFLDGADISNQLIPFGSGTYSAARILVQPGVHDLSCPGTCGIELYGYSEAVSYMFAGGLDLERIVIE